MPIMTPAKTKYPCIRCIPVRYVSVMFWHLPRKALAFSRCLCFVSIRMGNCCDKVEVANDAPTASRPLIQNDQSKTNSIYMPISSNFDHESSVKSNASSHRFRVSAEQAYLNNILQNIADQVLYCSPGK